jgi:hypothetical protein
MHIFTPTFGGLGGPSPVEWGQVPRHPSPAPLFGWGQVIPESGARKHSLQKTTPLWAVVQCNRRENLPHKTATM